MANRGAHPYSGGGATGERHSEQSPKAGGTRAAYSSSVDLKAEQEPEGTCALIVYANVGKCAAFMIFRVKFSFFLTTTIFFFNNENFTNYDIYVVFNYSRLPRRPPV